ncbi:MAG: hypothetical protein IPI17_13590 [Nitrosomonas sp.]|nr:hypothetical protein [Nitrosomonas sp.]
MEQHELTAVLFEAINAHLKAQGLLVPKVPSWMPHSFMRQVRLRIVNKHVILRVRQTKKGKQWYSA